MIFKDRKAVLKGTPCQLLCCAWAHLSKLSSVWLFAFFKRFIPRRIVRPSRAAYKGDYFKGRTRAYAVAVIRKRFEDGELKLYCSGYLINQDRLPDPSEERCEAYLRMAVREFLLTEAGRQAYEATCHDFNWGDVDVEISGAFWAAYGITPCSDGYFHGCSIITVCVDQDEQLGKQVYEDMKDYCITMERTLRVAVRFNAGSDELAEKRAIEIFNAAAPADFEGGEEECDYALCGDNGRLIIDWK